MKANSQHFRTWVPRWLVVTTAIIILIPIMLLNGAYTGTNIDVSSYLGVMSEDINISYFAASAGMAMAYPIVPVVRPVATTKTIILIVLFAQLILSWICATTTYIEIITFCSFMIGYFKAFSLIEIISIIMPIFSPSGTRNEFYSKFYPMTIGLSQLSLVLTAELANEYQWQYMYYLMIALLLIAMVMVVICMNFGRRLIRIPFNDIDWLSFFQGSITLLAMLYVMTYGKTLDWFNSPKILLATIIFPVLGWIFIRRQLLTNGRPFVDLNILKNRNSTVAHLFAFIMMFFASYTTLTSSYVNSVLRLNSARSNELYLYTLPGIIIGAFICYFFYKKAVRMAWLILIGFSCFTTAIALLYFKVEPTGLYEDLFIPMFLKGLGMVVLFVALAVYSVQGLQPKQLINNAFFMIAARSVLAPALGSCILTNWLYHLQQKNIMRLSESVDPMNLLATSQFTQSLKSNLAKGFSMEDAQKLATNALYAKVQIQSLTISIREILGYMLIIGIILLITIILYFFKYRPVRWMKVGQDMS